MRVTFCGTGGAGLDPARGGAAIHVATDATALLLDCGPGWLARFLAADLDPANLQAVLFSHFHFDHALGLGELLTRWPFEGLPLPRLYGPRDLPAYVEGALAFARTQHRFLSQGKWLPALDALVAEVTPPGSVVTVGDMTLSCVAVPHSAHLQALAWRVDAGGRALVYSGDCRAAPDVLVPFARGAHVLIHECYTEAGLEAFAGAKPPPAAAGTRGAFHGSHAALADVARLAQAAGVGTLVLTHFLPSEDADAVEAEAARYFRGEVLAAHDGLTIGV